MLSKDVVKKHFNNIANTYDSNNQKLYWQLCDQLLWDIISKNNGFSQNDNFSFLDIGGGTGEWSYKMLSEFPNSNGILVDFSREMLEQAKLKLAAFKGRIQIINSDVDDLNLNQAFDLILNIYLMPFYEHSEVLVNKLASLLRNNGTIISVAENYYNGIALNVLKGNIEEVNRAVQTQTGSLSRYVPPLKFCKMGDLERMYLENGIEPTIKCGFPVVSLIGVQEALSDEKNSLTKILGSNFDDILQLELDNIYDTENINRGKYLSLIGKRM